MKTNTVCTVLHYFLMDYTTVRPSGVEEDHEG
jgi:hypothetical protein